MKVTTCMAEQLRGDDKLYALCNHFALNAPHGIPRPMKYDGGRPGLRWHLALNATRDEIESVALQLGITVEDWGTIEVSPELYTSEHELSENIERWYLDPRIRNVSNLPYYVLERRS